MDIGSNTETTLELGRRLASHFDDDDTVGHWMSHHLAELVLAAEDDSVATIEQRQQIIELILKVWVHRRTYSRGGPLDDFTTVFAALNHLGDDRPWKFSRLLDVDKLFEESTPDPSPLQTAVELERLSRETIVCLIWLAANDAAEQNIGWLELADKVERNLESRVTQELRRLRRRIPKRRLITDNTELEKAEVTAWANIGMEEVETISSRVDDTEALDDPVPLDDTVDESRSYIDHAQQLREMARLLDRIADDLLASETANPEED
jgi:hypothetical protein